VCLAGVEVTDGDIFLTEHFTSGRIVLAFAFLRKLPKPFFIKNYLYCCTTIAVEIKITSQTHSFSCKAFFLITYVYVNHAYETLMASLNAQRSTWPILTRTSGKSQMR
jgi:hypothetical protein